MIMTNEIMIALIHSFKSLLYKAPIIANELMIVANSLMITANELMIKGEICWIQTPICCPGSRLDLVSMTCILLPDDRSQQFRAAISANEIMNMGFQRTY